MANITRRQMRRNERLETALEAAPTGAALANLAEQFFSEYTPLPCMADFGVFLTPLHAAREVVASAAPKHGQKILDFGAGMGVFSYALLEAGVPAENITAVEHTQTLYEIGSKLVPDVAWVGTNAFLETFWDPRMGRFDLIIGNPPWGRTRAREPWGPDDDSFGNLLLAGNGNSVKSAVAEAMSLEVALRLLRTGGRIVFLMPGHLSEREWSRYGREVAQYEATRQLRPSDVEFAQTKVRAQVLVVERNAEPFPGQVFAAEVEEIDEAQVEMAQAGVTVEKATAVLGIDDVHAKKQTGTATRYAAHHEQYRAIKAQHPDAIVLFRLGDFYEAFDEDAEIIARELDLVLTSRSVAKGVRVPMAGIPHHTVEGYITRLIEKGHRVALAEQVKETNAAIVSRMGNGDQADVLSEGWRLTQRQYQERKAVTVAGGVPVLDALDAREHERLVREALVRGEAVPAHVLANYPDLAEGAGHSSETDHELATLYRDWLSVTNGDESAYPSAERLIEYQRWAEELVVGGKREREGTDFRRFCRVCLEGRRSGFDLMVVGEAYANGRDFPAPEGWSCLQETDEAFYNRSWESGWEPLYRCVRCGCEPDSDRGEDWLRACGTPVYLCLRCRQELLAWKDQQIEGAKEQAAENTRAMWRARAAAKRKRKLPDDIPVSIEVDLGRSAGWATAEVISVKGRWLHYHLTEKQEKRGKVQLIGRDILWRPAPVEPN